MTARLFVLFLSATLITSCQTTPPEQYVWIRTDGQRGTGNPELEQQYRVDSTVCLGETQKTAANADPIYYNGLAGAITADRINAQRQAAYLDITKGCMAERGYVYVPVSQAQATAERFRKINQKPS